MARGKRFFRESESGNRFSDSAGFGAAIPAAFNFRKLILILPSPQTGTAVIKRPRS